MSNIGVIVFLSALGLVAFAVVQAIWGLRRETLELDGGESWGRQLTSRKKKSGNEMRRPTTVALTLMLFVVGIGVFVLLVYSFSF